VIGRETDPRAAIVSATVLFQDAADRLADVGVGLAADDQEHRRFPVEEAGVEDDEEIGVIQCENGDGDHTFHKVRLGKTLKLAENVTPEKARKQAEGCAV